MYPVGGQSLHHDGAVPAGASAGPGGGRAYLPGRRGPGDFAGQSLFGGFCQLPAVLCLGGGTAGGVAPDLPGIDGPVAGPEPLDQDPAVFCGRLTVCQPGSHAPYCASQCVLFSVSAFGGPAGQPGGAVGGALPVCFCPGADSSDHGVARDLQCWPCRRSSPGMCWRQQGPWQGFRVTRYILPVPILWPGWYSAI